MRELRLEINLDVLGGQYSDDAIVHWVKSTLKHGLPAHAVKVQSVLVIPVTKGGQK